MSSNFITIVYCVLPENNIDNTDNVRTEKDLGEGLQDAESLPGCIHGIVAFRKLLSGVSLGVSLSWIVTFFSV